MSQFGMFLVDILPSRRAVVVGNVCCAKAKMTSFRGIVVIACPDHPPMIFEDGKLAPLVPLEPNAREIWGGVSYLMGKRTPEQSGDRESGGAPPNYGALTQC